MDNKTLYLVNEMANNIKAGKETIPELYILLRQDKTLMETVVTGFYELRHYDLLNDLVNERVKELQVEFLERCFKK